MYTKKLIDMREEHNLKQYELAKIINLAPTTFNNYETEYEIMPIKHINKVTNFFDVSFDYLFEFIKIPGMDYIYGRDLFKDDVENKKKYEISLLIREYATCDNYIEVKSEKLKDVVNNEKYIKAINECKTWDDIYKLDHELNKILNRKSDTSE